MSKHTPGPWKIEGTPRSGWDIFSLAEGGCYVTSDPMRERAINYERDARLMAAAPELLEALERIANMGVPVQNEEHRIARAAIAKAKGE